MVSQNHQRHLLKSKNKRKNYYGRELERIVSETGLQILILTGARPTPGI